VPAISFGFVQLVYANFLELLQLRLGTSKVSYDGPQRALVAKFLPSQMQFLMPNQQCQQQSGRQITKHSRC